MAAHILGEDLLAAAVELTAMYPGSDCFMGGMRMFRGD